MEGRNKFIAPQEPTNSSMLKINRIPVKDSTQKQDSSSAHFMSEAAASLKQPTVQEPVMVSNVKNAASASLTRLSMVKAEILPSINLPENMSEYFREHPKRLRIKKSCCCCHQLNDNPAKQIVDLDDDQDYLLDAALSVHSARAQACSGPFWKKMEPFFAPIAPENLSFLKSVLNSAEELINQNQSQVVGEECQTMDVLKRHCSREGEANSLDQQSAYSLEDLGIAQMSCLVPSLYQRVLSAIIVEDEGEDFYNPDEGRSMPLQSVDGLSSSNEGYVSANDENDAGPVYSSQVNVTPVIDFDSQYELLPLDDRLSLELRSIGLFQETMPHSEGEVWIDQEIKKLKEKRYQQVAEVKRYLEKIDKAIQSGQGLEKRNTEEFALEQLTTMVYRRTMGGRRAGRKLPRKVGLDLIQHTLARYKEFENEGRSCFSEPNLQRILFSASSSGKDDKPIQCKGSRIGSGNCSDMHGKVTLTGPNLGLNTCGGKSHGFSGAQQASSRSSKRKNVIGIQSPHKDECVTRDRELKQKKVAEVSLEPATSWRTV